MIQLNPCGPRILLSRACSLVGKYAMDIRLEASIPFSRRSCIRNIDSELLRWFRMASRNLAGSRLHELCCRFAALLGYRSKTYDPDDETLLDLGDGAGEGGTSKDSCFGWAFRRLARSMPLGGRSAVCSMCSLERQKSHTHIVDFYRTCLTSRNRDVY